MDRVVIRPDRICTRLDQVDKRLEGLEKAIRKAPIELRSLFAEDDPIVISGRGPLKLTELGQQVADEIDASEWADSAVPVVLEQVAHMLEYDVQEFCFDSARGGLSAELLCTIKKSAYENGLDEWHVRSVMGLVLRDRLLALRDADSGAGSKKVSGTD